MLKGSIIKRQSILECNVLKLREGSFPWLLNAPSVTDSQQAHRARPITRMERWKKQERKTKKRSEREKNREKQRFQEGEGGRGCCSTEFLCFDLLAADPFAMEPIGYSAGKIHFCHESAVGVTQVGCIEDIELRGLGALIIHKGHQVAIIFTLRVSPRHKHALARTLAISQLEGGEFNLIMSIAKIAFYLFWFYKGGVRG